MTSYREFNIMINPIIQLLNKPIPLPFLQDSFRPASQLFLSPVHLEKMCGPKAYNSYYQNALAKQLTQPRKQFLVTGRSNCGKSSLINALTGQKLCKISKTPGKTRTLQFYQLGDKKTYLVDSVGYGFAEGASKNSQQAWTKAMNQYLSSKLLHRVILLVDVTIGIQKIDKHLISMLQKSCKPFHLVLTKCDRQADLARVQTEAREIEKNFPLMNNFIQLTSSRSGFGIEELRLSIAFMMGMQRLDMA